MNPHGLPKVFYRVKVRRGNGPPPRHGEIMSHTYRQRHEAMQKYLREKKRGRDVQVFKCEPKWIEVTEMWDPDAE